MSNVDITEVAKFDDIAHKWWDTEGEFKPLHQINPLRLVFIQSQIKLKDKAILDVGCGGGILTEALVKTGGSVTGIDMSAAALKVAEMHQYDHPKKATYRHITVEKLADEMPNRFDVITCMELLEHVPQPESVVAACTRLIKPGGWLFFSTLNRNLKSYLFAVIGAEYILGMIPKGTHDYAKFIKPSELSKWCRANQLSTQHIKGLGYNPLSKVYSLTEDTSVNYLMSLRKDI